MFAGPSSPRDGRVAEHGRVRIHQHRAEVRRQQDASRRLLPQQVDRHPAGILLWTRLCRLGKCGILV